MVLKGSVVEVMKSREPMNAARISRQAITIPQVSRELLLRRATLLLSAVAG